MQDVINCLKWYIQEDDTWLNMEGNEYWIAGRRRAIEALLKIDSTYVDPDL